MCVCLRVVKGSGSRAAMLVRTLRVCDADMWQMQVLCVHFRDCLCDSAGLRAKQINTAGLLHAVCLIVCLP